MEKRKAAKEIFLAQTAMEDDFDEAEESQNFYDPAPAGSPALQDSIQNEAVRQVITDISEQISTPYNSPEQKGDSMSRKSRNYIPDMSLKSSEEMQLEKDPIQIRITGNWFWKKVIVPPNVYVVHTRLNRKEPVTLGLGVSFRYNSQKDAYIVIPAAMQTIGVVANCISKEKQGVNVLAYVQWQIADFSIAYKKLDFTNTKDPLGIVNAQLREQAEAAIKDKVATMSVEEVLTDKAPVISELTSRLRDVAEGQEGLGIKIITVQIREAVVSSSSLWNDLQSPFRNEQKKKARISQLEMENEIHTKELETRKLKENREADTNLEIEQKKQQKLTEVIDLKLKEELKRFEEEQKSKQTKQSLEEETIMRKKETDDRIATKEKEILLRQSLEEMKRRDAQIAEETKIQLEAEKRRLAQESEQKLFEMKEQEKQLKSEHEVYLQKLDREKLTAEKEFSMDQIRKNFEYEIEQLRVRAELRVQEVQKEMELNLRKKENEIQLRYKEEKIRLERFMMETENLMNGNHLTSKMIAALPEIAAQMPEIKELKILQSDGSDPMFDGLTVFIQKILSLSENFNLRRKK